MENKSEKIKEVVRRVRDFFLVWNHTWDGDKSGESVLCGEMLDHFNHGKCWSKASGPISSVSSWMELSDQTWTINCSALSLMPTIERRMLSFKDKVVHESWPNEFLSYPASLRKRMKELLGIDVIIEIIIQRLSNRN